MFQQYFHHKGLVALPILTMLLFGVVFLAVLVRALRQRPDAQLVALPLEDAPAAAPPKGCDHV